MCCPNWCYVMPKIADGLADPLLFMGSLLFLVLGIIAFAFAASRLTRKSERNQRSRKEV